MMFFRRVSLCVLLAALGMTSLAVGQIDILVGEDPFGPAIAVEAPAAEAEQQQPAVDENRPRLDLANGDMFSGALADSDQAGALAWQADGFVRPFVFRLSAVGGVQFPFDAEAKQAQGEFCVELFDGDVLFGSLEELTAETLTLATEQFGPLRIDRDQIRQIERWGSVDSVKYFGPNGMTGWTPTDAGSGAWRAAAGRIEADGPGALSLSACPVPPRCMIEVELSWRKRADFSLTFVSSEQTLKDFAAALPRLINGGRNQRDAQQARPSVALELAAIGGQLVMIAEGQKEADLAALGELGPDRHRLQVQLYLDPKSRTASAYSYGGKQIAAITIPADAVPTVPGQLHLVNRSGDLRVDRLVVREWTGAPPADVSLDKSFVQRTSGEVVTVADVTIAAENDESDGALAAASADLTAPIPLKEIARVAFPRSQDRQETPDNDDGVRAATRTGLRINGRLVRVAAGVVELQRSGVAERFSLPVAELQSLESLVKTTAKTNGDQPIGRLELAGGSSKGALVAGDGAAAGSGPGHCLVWRPIRSATASPLSPGVSGRIVYRTPPPPPQPAPATQPRVMVRQANPVAGVLRAFSRAMSAPVQRTLDPNSNQLLWLKAGDCIPCRITGIDERGVSFESSAVEAKFVPHKLVKAWDRVAGTAPTMLDPRKFERLLTLPRMQRDNPPLQLLESHDGDFLRGRIVSLDDEAIEMEVRLETRRIPREKVARIIWLDDFKRPPSAQSENPAPGGAAVADAAGESTGAADELLVQAVRSDGVRLTFAPREYRDGMLRGARDPLGACHVELTSIDQLLIGQAIADEAAKLVYGVWRLHAAPDPRYISDPEGAANTGRESGLVGQDAPDFTLSLLGGGEVKLSDHRGKVVVLEFWATWCGFCMQAMPRVAEVVGAYPEDRVLWLAVNLQEDERTITPALERLNLSPQVPLDIDGATAEKFQVSGLPQTVVVGPDGKVANVFVGSGPRGEEDLKAAIEAAFNPAAKDEQEPAPDAAGG